MTASEVLESIARIDREKLAVIVRNVWAEYAGSTLPKPPKAFTKSWSETGEWGREGNRKVVTAILAEITKELESVYGKNS